MREFRGFEGVMRASLYSLCAFSFLGYVGLAAFVLVTEWPVRDWRWVFMVPAGVALAGIMMGAVVVAVFAAPVYYFLARRGRASFLSTALIGFIPGVALFAYEDDLGWPAMFSGIVIGLATHWLCRRSGSNNSSKPTPLRGAA